MKKKVAIVFGGRSTEHAVSCASAYSIAKNIDRELFDTVLIGVTGKGEWLPYRGEEERLLDGSWEKEAGARGICSLSKGIEALEECDAVFPVIHGQNGEDGTVQGLLELTDIPYVGCGVLASAVCMDKVFTKKILQAAGVPQCRYIAVSRRVLRRDVHAYDAHIERELGFPCFVKPANCGSSVGVHKVASGELLEGALLDAARYDSVIVAEEFADGREIECAVLGNSDAAASVPGEVKPAAEFYDYADKYINGVSAVCIPADISRGEAAVVKALALRAYAACGCSGLARVDFFLKRSGEVVLNEINTLPGFTDISMYGKLWDFEGMTYRELITELINLAYDKKRENMRCTE